MKAARARQESVASLRLPVPFFDLLMVLLVTCLVFVAPVQPENDIRAMDMPIAHGQGGSGVTTMMPVVPVRTGATWAFEIVGEGQTVAAETLAQRTSGDNRKVVLVVPPATPLQEFVSMQASLAEAKVPFALAVQNKETPQ